MKWFASALFFLLVSIPSFGQLTVQNEKNIDFPRDKAEVIYRTACRVVGEELRLTNNFKSDFPLTLVLGEKDERYTADDEKHLYFVYLNNWNENLFASSTMMLAIHRVIPPERQQKMLVQIIRRSNGQSTVNVNSLREHK